MGVIAVFSLGLTMRFSRPVLTRRGNIASIIWADRLSWPHCTQLVPHCSVTDVIQRELDPGGSWNSPIKSQGAS